MRSPQLVAVLLSSLLFFSGRLAAEKGGDRDGDGDRDGGSPVSSSTSAASCPAKLRVVPAQLIPFSTSSLSCYTAWSAQDFVLLYKKEGPSLWSFVLSAPESNAYISVGFSPNGRMVGSSAVAGWSGGNGGPGKAKRYYLGGQTPDSCPPDQGDLRLVNNSAAVVSQSPRLYLAFQLNTTQPSSRLIYAVGPQGQLPGPDNLLPTHRGMVSTTVDYATGQSSTDAGPETMKTAHGALAAVGWGLLLPVGVVAARYCKHWDPLWFYAHVSLQGLGFGLGVAGVVTGFSLEEKVSKEVDTHKALGILILVMGSLQVMALLARPGKESKVRKYWNWYHHYVGRAAIALAIANTFYGLSLADEKRSWSVGYGVFLGAWFLVSLVLEVWMHTTNRRRR